MDGASNNLTDCNGFLAVHRTFCHNKIRSKILEAIKK